MHGFDSILHIMPPQRCNQSLATFLSQRRALRSKQELEEWSSNEEAFLYFTNGTKTTVNFFDDDFKTSMKQKIANNIRSYSGWKGLLSNIKPPRDFISGRMARPVEATDSEHMTYFEGALTPDMMMRTLQAFIDKREDHPESLIDIGTCPIHVCEPAEYPVAGCPPSLPAEQLSKPLLIQAQTCDQVTVSNANRSQLCQVKIFKIQLEACAAFSSGSHDIAKNWVWKLLRSRILTASVETRGRLGCHQL